MPVQETISPTSTENTVISLKDASLSFASNTGQVDILKDINLDIPAGQSVAILGPSGAGKTSLLMLISGLETLSAGKAVLAGQDITTVWEQFLDVF